MWRDAATSGKQQRESRPHIKRLFPAPYAAKRELLRFNVLGKSYTLYVLQKRF